MSIWAVELVVVDYIAHGFEHAPTAVRPPPCSASMHPALNG